MGSQEAGSISGVESAKAPKSEAFRSNKKRVLAFNRPKPRSRKLTQQQSGNRS